MGAKRECGEVLVGLGAVKMGSEIVQGMSKDFGVGHSKAVGTDLGAGLDNIANSAENAALFIATPVLVIIGLKTVLKGFDPNGK